MPSLFNSASVRTRSSLVLIASIGRQPRQDRRHAQLLDAVLVHEGGIEVAHLLPLGAGRIVFGGGAFLDDLMEVGFGLVDQGREGPVVGAVGGDFRLFQPRAVDRTIEVILEADRGVKIRPVDAAGQRVSGRRLRRERRARRRRWAIARLL